VTHQPDEDPTTPTGPRRARSGSASRSAASEAAPGAAVRATDLGVRPSAPRTPGREGDLPPNVGSGSTDASAGEDLPRTDVPTGVDGPAEAAVTAAADPETPGDASPPPSCPLLRRLGDEGRLAPAGPTVDAWHRCTAETPPAPLADQQQSLVCLTEAHVDCPRYRRAAAPVPIPVRDPVSRAGLSPATLAATVVLAMSFLAALSFVAVNGGIGVPSPVPSDGVAAASTAPSVRPSPTASLGSSPAEVSPSPIPSATDIPSPSPEPSVAPSATPVPSTRPSSAAPSPTSDRYRLLVACPDRPDCYVYTVRRGDNLTSIGLYFGVPFDTILRLNAWITDPANIHAGDVIILPPPTR
jgi:hypothetical protein